MTFPYMIYGGDYNPEQWPEEIWLEDAELMQEAGVNLVSLGIFSWAKMEPNPGIFDFEWLDRLFDLLHSHGISVNLATPTASPPAWMVRLHPQMLPVTAEGVTLWHGSRRHYCPHNDDYQEYAIRIATKLAERYKDHPALNMWHVDNEYGCHVGECFCENSAIAFRKWLKNRYTTLEKLNNAWGTAFWGQRYSDWVEIQPPHKAPAFVNPTQQLDWARFSSDSWISCFEKQKEVLRQITPKIPITTNFMGFHKSIDYWKFASREDIVSNDNYPDTSKPDWMVESGMICDLMRSLGNNHPWILMEQAASQVNWRERNAVKRPGVMRLGSYQAIARGASGIMFFQWRASRAGAEKFHSGMLPHAGINSRVWREVKSLGMELSRLDTLLSSEVQSHVAILMDWENWWALELDSKPSAAIRLLPRLMEYYAPLFRRNITVNFVHPSADLSHYKLVIAPNLYLVDEVAVENINRYLENGGTLVMSFFSGIVDENEHIRLGGYPAPFQKMLGLLVEDFIPYSEKQTNTFLTSDSRKYNCSLWSDVIELQGADVLATFQQDYYAGNAAITRHIFGKGTAYYVGTAPDKDGMDWLIGHICGEASIQSAAKNLTDGVEITRRTNGTTTWLIALNYTDKEVDIPVENSAKDLLTGIKINKSISIEPNGVAILEEINKNL